MVQMENLVLVIIGSVLAAIGELLRKKNEKEDD